MGSLLTAGIALACQVGGLAVGQWIRGRLPEDHLRDDSRDVLKLASGVIATLVALVIGLLVNSSKAAYDQASMGATQIGAKVILLDRVLKRYGPETREIRQGVVRGIATSIDRLWPRSRGATPDLAAIEQVASMDDVLERVERIEPRDEAHRAMRAHALDLLGELAQARWLMIEQAQARLPTPFLAMLIFWLAVLFASLGLLAPRNATVRCGLLICAVSMAGAIDLILEMSHPLEGAIQISPAPLHKALSIIGK